MKTSIRRINRNDQRCSEKKIMEIALRTVSLPETKVSGFLIQILHKRWCGYGGN